MDSARTAWAEGMGLPEEQIEALTLVSEEATRQRDYAIAGTGGHGAQTALVANLHLPPGDVDEWPAILEEAGLDELAERVREVRS